jgi:hypothetical protein
MENLCGKCNKPKGKGEGFCKCGRPIEYKEEYILKADEYLESNKDIEKKIVKQANNKKGYEMYDNKIVVNLPTIEGFALFIGVDKSTLYDWSSIYPEFSYSLEKIKTEQQKRLINCGLSGEYNSTIAKLILSSNHGMREKSDLTTNDKDIPTPIYNGLSKT